jgi:hypothetical protein
VEHVFLSATQRPPTARERELADRVIAACDGNVDEALTDIWWALLNSNEFLLER